MEGKQEEEREDEGSKESVKEITLCRHIPASQPYVPADYVIIRQSFPAVVPWRKAFEDLSAELEWMVESWPTRKPEMKGDGRDVSRGKVEEATKTTSKTDFNNWVLFRGSPTGKEGSKAGSSPAQKAQSIWRKG